MYKVLIIDTTTIGNVEAEINEVAREGYRFVGILQMAGRGIIIMEEISTSFIGGGAVIEKALIPNAPRPRGRPKKVVTTIEE